MKPCYLSLFQHMIFVNERPGVGLVTMLVSNLILFDLLPLLTFLGVPLLDIIDAATAAPTFFPGM